MRLKLHLSHNVKRIQDPVKDWPFKREVKSEYSGCWRQRGANSSHGYKSVDCDYFCGVVLVVFCVKGLRLSLQLGTRAPQQCQMRACVGWHPLTPGDTCHSAAPVTAQPGCWPCGSALAQELVLTKSYKCYSRGVLLLQRLRNGSGC